MNTKERPFVSNIGTPQRDSLSPVLFSVYLENALKEVRTILPRPTNELEKTLPTEIAYTDDVDFVGLIWKKYKTPYINTIYWSM